jgi:hypothetical protein
VIDRVNTTMAVWMGTSMACAQCHSHKYDPLSQTEYFRYSLFQQHGRRRPKDEAPVLNFLATNKGAARARPTSQRSMS